MDEQWQQVLEQVCQFYWITKDSGTHFSLDGLDTVIKQFASVAHLNPDEDKDAFSHVYRAVRQKLELPVDSGIVITGDDSHWRPWLNADENQNLKFPRTTAYYRYLFAKHGLRDSSNLRKATDSILGLLSDPRRDVTPQSRRGLILGDVQSGKTRTYMSLMNRAADYGYKLFIILTSDNESLRQQTQERIESDFLGVQNGNTTGIRDYLDGDAAAPTCLTSEGDFNAKAHVNQARPSWRGAPIVVVMKKNGTVLKKFNNWLDSDAFEDRDVPILVIDDESDYGSVNTAKSEEDPTAINKLIRELVSIGSRTSYVAVTATPFANIFIDDQASEDLFPRDFIYVLDSPDAYIGALEIFGDRNQEGAEEDDSPYDLPQRSPVRYLDENELTHWLPLGHTKTFDFALHAAEDDSENSKDELLDPQVAHAINTFLVACVLKPQNNEPTETSMLIHMSRFLAVQEQIADRVYAYVNATVNALTLHSADANEPRIEALKEAFLSEYSEYAEQYNLLWEDVRVRLCTLALSNRLCVRLENSESDDWNKAHHADGKIADNECTLFVGGNRLSRGMTLKGLVCSIFYRNVTAADTLLQMGRWFGYRNGYEELQRVWMLPQTVADFKYSASIVEDIKHRARDIMNNRGTPKEFGISIKKNPNQGVVITSGAKMRNAEQSKTAVEFDFTNQIIESVRLSNDADRNAQNEHALKELRNAIAGNPEIAESVDKSSSSVVYEGVPATVVSAFLTQYRAGYADTFFGPVLIHWGDRKPLQKEESLAQRFAATQIEQSDQDGQPAPTWNVAFISKRSAKNDGTWTPVRRSYTPDFEHNTYRVSGNKQRLGSKTDPLKVAQALSNKPLNIKVGNERELYDTRYFGDHPTLMLYRVEMKNDPKKAEAKGIPNMDMVQEQGLLGAKIIVPSDDPVQKTRRGRTIYYLNTVAARQEYNRLRDEDAVEDED